MTAPLTSSRVEIGSGDVQDVFVQRGWGDGLPVVPPTPELVRRFVDAVGREPGDVLADLPEQATAVTVEKVAVNAVMAGAREEYMDVLVSAFTALGDKRYNLHGTTLSGATAPLLVVSGPVVSRIGLNSRYTLFGPGHHANATIGRAVRLVLQNVCGGRPGVVDKATFGHPGKYAYCIAEDTGWNPWEPIPGARGVDPEARGGVTVYAGEGPIMCRNDWSSEHGPILDTIADAMLPSHYTGGGVCVVMGPRHAEVMARAGLGRADVQAELHARARRTEGDLYRAGRRPVPPDDPEAWRHVVPSPEDVLVVVAGGDLYGYSAVVPSWIGGHESKPVTVDIAVATEPAAARAVPPGGDA